MADFDANFRYDSDFTKVTEDIKNLVREATNANSVFAQLNKTAASVKMEAARSFSAQAGFAGFKAQVVDLTGATEQFGQQLMKNKLTMKEYFSEAAKAYKKDSRARALAEREVRRAQSAVVGMGDINGRRKGILLTPDSLDMSKSTTQLQIASKQYEVFNDLVQKGSTALVNWGKNTQWAGRQLTVGLTVPMGIFTSQALKAFAALDEEVTRFRKVYGSDLTGTVGDATDQMVAQIKAMGSEFAKQYGIASKETMALAADLAAAGLEGQKLANAVNQTTRMMVLGEVDRQEAMKATLSIQTAFNQSSKELAKSVDFLNAVENQTSASLQDLVEAIPKTGPVIQALGGDIKDLSVLMTALREGGINAAEGANALKSGMASLISPTTKATELAKTFGIDLQGIVRKNKGELMPMLLDFQDALSGLDQFGKAKLIEEIFGKYQFARISALFDNLNQQGSQTVGMVKLLKASSDELAKKSYSELKAQENAPSTRLAAMQQQLQENLIKVGADLAETLLPIMQGALDILQKIVDGFNNLPAPIKNFAKIIGGITAAAGPILMLAGIFGNLIGNAIKFGMSIVNLFKRMTGHPVQQLQILSDEELAAKLAANQLTGAYERQRTSVMELNAALDIYIANLRTAATIAPPGAVSPRGRGPVPPIRRANGGIIYAKDGVDSGGRINGYGGGDTVPAMLEPGEFVINKQSSQKYKGLLTDINQGKDVPGYSKAGEVGIGGATPGTASNSISSGSEKSVSLKALLGFGGQTPEAALASLSDSEIKAFEKLLVKENDFKDVLGKLKRANIPGFKDIPLKDYALGLGTDRAHFAALENLLLYTDEADKVNKFVANKEFLFSTTSDSKGINQLVDNIKYPETLARLEKALGYIPGSLHRIIADTRPIIVNPELRDFFSRLQNGMMDINNPILQQELSDIILQKSGGGGFSANKAAKLVGAFAANEKAIAHSGDPIKVREILDSQIKHALAQTATKEEWQRIKQFHQGSINELIDMFMSGKPVDVDKVRRISSAFTNRRLLTERESLILTEYRNISGEMKKLTNEQRSALAAIPESEKKALIKELGLAERVGVAKQEVLTTKGGRKAVRGISPKILSESMHGVPVGKGAGILPEVQLRKGFREVMTPRGPVLVPYANGGLVLPNGTSIQNGILHAAGGFTGFRGFGQGRPGQYSYPSWKNPTNRFRDKFRFEGEQIEGALGKSTKGELSGVYKLKGQNYYVKTFNDELSVLAEVSANRILKKMFPDLAIPESRIGKVGKSNQLAAISPMMRTLTQEQMGAGKLSEQGVVDAMLAQSLAGGRDLSPGNLMGEGFGGNAFTKVAHVDPSEAFIKTLASGKPAMSPAELTDPAQRALANFGVIKGGARRYGRDTLAGMGISSGRLEVMMRRSLARASSVRQEDLIMEVRRGLEGMPKNTRRTADAWAKQMGHASFEEAITSIAMQRIQKVSEVIPQLAAATGAKSVGRSIVTGLSIRTKAQEQARQDAIRAHIGENRIGELASDRFKPLVSNELIGNPYAEAIMNASPLRARRVIPEIANMQRIQPHDRMVYRGTQLTEEELAAIRSGLPFDLSKNILTPTSTNQAVAEHMANIGGAGEKLSGTKAVFRIKTKAGMVEVPFQDILGGKPVWLKDLGGFNEAEIAYAKMQARLIGEQKIGDTIYFDVEALQNQALFPELMRGSLSTSKIVKMNTGGKLPGFGGGDKVPAMLEPGEFVINKDATKENLGLLEQINSNGQILKRKTGGIIPGYAAGGLVAEAGMAGMNLMFLPMMYEQAKSSEGIMQKMLYALVAIQGMVGIIQMTQVASGIAGKLGQAGGLKGVVGTKIGNAGLALRTKGATMAAQGGGKAMQFLSKGIGSVGSGLMRLAAFAGPLTAVAGVATAAVIAWKMWKNHVEDLANTAKSFYTEATEMAKVYNIELNKTSNALKENRQYAEAFGTVGKGVVGKGQVDKDYEAAVTKDYEKAIEGIKSLNNEQDKANRLASIYSSLVTQGYSLDQAKEITAEIARQAQATSAFNSVYPKLQSAIKDTETAMQVLDTTFAYHYSQLGTVEERVAALTEAYARLQAASNFNPTQSVISTQNLVKNAAKTDGGDAVKELVNSQFANAGIDGAGVNEILKSLVGTTDVDWASQTGQDLATTILAGLNSGMTKEDFVKSAGLDDVKVKVGVTVAMQDAKLALNKELELVIKELQDGINEVNDLYDDKIAAVEKEKEAIQDAHDKKMKALEEEANALRDRGDLIRDNTDFYIKQLEKEYTTEQYYQNQRKNAAGGLEALSKGDIFGYLQAQMQSASDAEQFGREQAIQQIEDTRDSALKALDAQLKANDAAKGALDEATQKQLDGKDNQIEALNIARSKIIKDLNTRIKEAQAIMASPGIATKKIDEFQTKLNTSVQNLPKSLQKPFDSVGENLAGTVQTTLNKKASEINSVFVKNSNILKKAIEGALGTVKYTYDPKKGSTPTATLELPGGYKVTISNTTPADAGKPFEGGGGNGIPDAYKGYTRKPVGMGTSEVFNAKGKSLGTFSDTDFYGRAWNQTTGGIQVSKLPIKKNMGGKIMKFGMGTNRMVPGFGNSDTVSALLTPGEFVSDATATRRNLPVLQAMNAGATFTVPQLRNYNGTMGAENETYNNNVNMPVNITINGSNLTIDQIKNDIYGELVKAKNMVVNSIGEYR